jgi:hypothetical protein
MACYGFKCGFAKSLRTIVSNAGSVLALGAAFCLPFSPFVGKTRFNILGKMIDRFSAMISGKIPDFFKGIVAKLIVVIFLAIFFY